MNELETPEQRAEAARPFVRELSKLAPPAVTLFGIEQQTLELLDYRQDCVERLAELDRAKCLDGPDFNYDDQIADVTAELSACNMELARLAGAEVQKVDNIANLLRMCDRMIGHRKDERDRQNKAAKRWEAIKEGVEQVVMEALTLADRTRFDSPTNTLRMQRNGSPRVDITDAQAVQDRFVKVVVEVTADRWKQMKQALPELSEFCVEKERTFITSAIAKVLKSAVAADSAIEERISDPKLVSEAKKAVERVRGAKLVHGRHLRCE